MSRRARIESSPISACRRGKGARGSREHAAPYFRRLRLEPLEDRRLLAVVNVLHDSSIADASLTLREAIVAAAPGETITFDPSLFTSGPATIQLTNVGHVGEIAINKALTIQGPGDKVLTVKAFAGTAALGDGARIFHVDDGGGTADKIVAISGLTLTGGDVASSTGGGAIRNAESLTLTGLTVSGNSAGSASVGYHGGGIVNFSGNLAVVASTISGNSTTFGRGAGIYSHFGSVTIERSTISGNAAGSTGSGGGIYTGYTTVNINSSTISGNSANVGGGIVQEGIGFLMTITNSTVSGNSARSNGGGVVALFSDVSVLHSTITANRSDADNNGTGNGGGIFVNPTFSSATINHTIVAGNFKGSGSTRYDISGAVTARFSLVGDNSGSTIMNVIGNQIGTNVLPIDPKLGPLGGNGGQTETHALLAGGPAIDMGELAIASPPANDQRAAPFVRIFDGDGVGGARIDIGAYERQTLPGLSLVVDTLVDESNLTYSAGDLSLREAIGLANGSVGFGTITFAGTLTSGGPAEILLTRGQLLINESADVLGPGSSLMRVKAFDPDLAVHGNGWRIFEVNDGITANLLDVEISGLALSGGDNSAARGGGAIFSRENLRVANSSISGNRTTQIGSFTSGSGGGISNVGGNLEVVSSSIFFNDAHESGGGIYNLGGDLTVVDSTITGNDTGPGSQGYGGGIYHGGGDLTLTRTTIGLNHADRMGGGISNRNGNVQVVDSKILENSAGYFGGGIGMGGAGTGAVYIFDSEINDNSAPFGGAINNFGDTLSVSRSTITGNTADYGGAIRNSSGDVTLYISIVSGNEATIEGGGIYSQYGTLDLDGVTISDNTAATIGGGISNHNSTLTIAASTISDNRAITSSGGGIRTQSAAVEISNSTISGNDSEGNGAGIEIAGGNLTVRNSTISNNQTDIAADGGGIAVTSGTVFLHNTIVAENRSFHAGADDIKGAVTVRYCFIGTDAGASITVQVFSLIGVGTVIDPLLGQLAENGGPSKTHAVLAGSPVIDMGDPAFAAPPSSDQRKSPFVRVYDGDGGGARIDIGAYERQTVAGLNLVVDSLDDKIDHKYLAGRLSLREALGLANGSVGNNTVTFAAALTSGGPATIRLTNGELWITDAVTVVGPGASLLTVDVSYSDPTFKVPNGDGSRVLHVDDSVYFVTPADVELSGLTLTGGDAPDSGGAIYSWEDLTLRKMTITGNHANHSGGGVLAQQSILTVIDSTISDNSATFAGGGLHNNFGALTVSESTVSGNTSGQSGGGIWTTSGTPGLASASIYSSTISGNISATSGGGIYSSIGAVEIRRSTITKNQAAANSGGGVASTSAATGGVEVELSIIADNTTGNDVQNIGAGSNPFVSSGYNLIGTGNATGAFSPGTFDKVGVPPMLGPLAFNGGPTKTHALLPGSMAIDGGNPGIPVSPGVFDQRGNPFVRVYDGNNSGGAQIDIGAFELQPIPSAVYGDYSENGVVDAFDYTIWRNTLGTGGLTPYDGADGSGNGTVGPEDYGVWKMRYGDMLPMGSGGGGVSQEDVSSDQSQFLRAFFDGGVTLVTPSAPRYGGFIGETDRPNSSESPKAAVAYRASRNINRDEALMAWLATRMGQDELRDGDTENGNIGSLVECDSAAADEAIVDVTFDAVGTSL